MSFLYPGILYNLLYLSCNYHLMSNNFFIPQVQPLKSIVQLFWQTNWLTQFATETIIPRGIIEIIFDFSEQPVHASLSNAPYRLARCFINGFNTRPITLQLPQRQNFFGVRLHPMAVKNIVGIPPGQFANAMVDLTLIDASIHHIWQQLLEQETFTQKVAAFSDWVTKKWRPLDNREEMINRFLTSTGDAVSSVTQLAADVCYSPRQLTRKMFALTGMNTEETLLYKKFLLATHLMHSNNMSLTQVAYHCQFADQSHFIRTFKQFASITPGEYAVAKSQLPGHIYQDVR
jgi:AraC-like DNA-binding protein